MKPKAKTHLNPQLFPQNSPQVDQPPQEQLPLYDLQQQVGGLRALHQPDELEYKALTLAYEAMRLVWMAAGNSAPQCRKQVEILDAAQQTVAEHLLTPATLPPEPVPVALPDWLEVA